MGYCLFQSLFLWIIPEDSRAPFPTQNRRRVSILVLMDNPGRHDNHVVTWFRLHMFQSLFLWIIPEDSHESAPCIPAEEVSILVLMDNPGRQYQLVGQCRDCTVFQSLFLWIIPEDVCLSFSKPQQV